MSAAHFCTCEGHSVVVHSWQPVVGGVPAVQVVPHALLHPPIDGQAQANSEVNSADEPLQKFDAILLPVRTSLHLVQPPPEPVDEVTLPTGLPLPLPLLAWAELIFGFVPSGGSG